MTLREKLSGQPLAIRMALMHRNLHFRFAVKSVKRRGPLRLALDYRRDYIRLLRGLPLT
jgi:hypothetical protein